MPKYLVPIDLNKNEIQNARLQNLASAPSSPVVGQIYYDTSLLVLRVWDGTSWHNLTDGQVSSVSVASPITSSGGSTTPTIGIQAASGAQNGYFASADYTLLHGATASNTASTIVLRDGSGNFAAGTITATVLTGLNAPVGSSDAASKGYVDSVSSGISWKTAVRLATTAALAANTYNNGTAGVGATLTANANGALSVDGVAVTVGDRILVKNEVAAANNGIYTVTATGSGGAVYVLTRATDLDSSAELSVAAAVFASLGSTNADTEWVLQTTGSVTPGTTALPWIQFGAATSYSAGSGITISGNTISISASYAGQTSITTLGTITTGVWNGTAIAVANGGTGATTAAGARTNLAATGKYSALIGDGVSASIAITQSTHGLASNAQMVVSLYDASTADQVFANVNISNSNGTITVSFATAPASNAIRIVVVG
jgi:hypothetical protein